METNHACTVAGLAPAVAQQNPFVGTWSTSLMTPNGAGMTAYVDFYPNGTVHLSGVVTGGGMVMHEWGDYRVDPARSIVSYVFRAYGPQTYANGFPAPRPPNINQPVTVGYQFANPYHVIFSDGAVYIRQPGNPYPAPNR
jgi:hypothetical protein